MPDRFSTVEKGAVSHPFAGAPVPARGRETEPVAAAAMGLSGGIGSLDAWVYAEWTRDAARYESMVALLAARPDGEIVLNVVDREAGAATARAVWSRDGGLVFLADHLPRLPDEKCYQLWVLRNTSPAVVSAGLVSLDGNGRGILIAKARRDLDHVTGFAITGEPKGGSVVARGRKLLVGTE